MREISEQAESKATVPSPAQQVDATQTLDTDLYALSTEIVDLFYTQAFTPEQFRTESAVCQAFADLLLRHWHLCCVTTFLQDAKDGQLRESAIHMDEHLNQEEARRAVQLLAATIEQDKREWQVWLDRKATGQSGVEAEVRRVFEDAGIGAGVAVPIHARGALVGMLVVVTTLPEHLQVALRGIHLIAAPIVIAVSNARRTEALAAQRQHIDHLVEELQQHSHALENANRELQRIARYRSLFLGRMSHELRTPLTAMLGFAEILLDQEDLTPAQRQFCERIQASGLQLQASLNQLVDLSRIEAGKMELFLHEFPLRETLRESCGAVARLARNQDVTLDCRSGSDTKLIVSDEGKLRQVLYNFLAFAISRSPAGGRVTLRAEELAAQARFRLTIQDDGEPLLNSAAIFEPTDSDPPNERGTNMNELGLVIAHRLIEALGGSVTLDLAAKSPGLTVVIELPARPTKT